MKLSVIFLFVISSCFASPTISDLTLEEKVGQILITHFKGDSLNAEAKVLIEDLHVGGIIYYNWANDLSSPNQVSELSSNLQMLAKIPLLIATDQEGGLVARLSKGFTIFPGNKALGVTGQLELAEECAFAMGQEMLSVGINMNLAPVVDINNNPRNPVIGIRSFGDSSETVTAFAKKALQGYHRAGVMTSLKHFPGHGDVISDSHEELPIIKKTKEELQKLEFIPFASLAQNSDTVMTAHVMIPSLDAYNCATLSKPILDILRLEMNFKGVILSDSLVMEALLKNGASIKDIAIQAFNAGCDMLILGGKQLIGTRLNYELTIKDIYEIHQSLVEAVKSGLISQTRLNESVERILRLKSKYSPLLASQTTRKSHEDLAKKIATLALRVKGNSSLSLLKGKQLSIFAPAIIEDVIKQTPFLTIGNTSSSLFFKTLNPSSEEILSALSTAQKSDAIIFCSYNAWQNPTQTTLIDSLLKTKKPLILVVLRDPLDAELFPSAELTLITYSPTIPSIEAAYNYLKNY